MSFVTYNGVKQTTVNSCGAFSLAAAFSHFGLAQMPYVLDTANLSQGYTLPGPEAFAQRIYQITGNLSLDIMQRTATYRYGNPVSDFNSFSSLTYVANLFGMEMQRLRVHYNENAESALNLLQVSNYSRSCKTANLLQTEIDLITGPAYANVTGPAGYTQLPLLNAVHLLVVDQFMHSVVINAHECYDPATGYVGPYSTNAITSLTPLTQITYRHQGMTCHMAFSGLWLQMN